MDLGLDETGDPVDVVHHGRHIRKNKMILALEDIGRLILSFQRDGIGVVDKSFAEGLDLGDRAFDGKMRSKLGKFIHGCRLCHNRIYTNLRFFRTKVKSIRKL